MTFSLGDRVLAEDSEASGYGTIICRQRIEISGDDTVTVKVDDLAQANDCIEQPGETVWYGVEMDIPLESGHSLDGRCPAGRGRWFRARSLRPASPAVDERKFLEVIL